MPHIRSMGYDMTVVTPDAGEEGMMVSIGVSMEEALHARHAESMPMTAFWDVQQKVEDLFAAAENAYRSGFFLNLPEMRTARELMRDYNMLDMTVSSPQMIDVNTYGLTSDMASLADPRFPDALRPPELRKYLKDMAAVTDGRAENPEGIPLYKLCTSDHWLVTPEEILSALARAGELVPILELSEKHPDYSWWKPWITYLGFAVTHDGFRVD